MPQRSTEQGVASTSSPWCVLRLASVTLGVLVAALVLSCSPAGAGEVQIYPPTAGIVVPPIDLDGLASADIVNRSYSVSSMPGGPPNAVTVTGYSLSALIATAKISVGSFNVAEIGNPAGYPVLLSRAEATDTAVANPPVFWGSGDATYFADSDPADYVDAPVNGLQVTLLAGALLSVTISSSARHATTGRQVHLMAHVGGALPGESLSYAWQFDDASGGSGASIDHAYSVAGTYDVYVQVTGSKESIGSAVIPVEIGKAPRGPNRNGGGVEQSHDAPTHGAGERGLGRTKSSGRTGKEANPPEKARVVATITASAASSLVRAPDVKPVVPRRVRVKRARRVGPLLSGTALASIRQAPNSSPVAPAGVVRAARRGHLVAAHHPLAEGVWIILGALAIVLLGALLEWAAPSRALAQGRLSVIAGPGARGHLGPRGLL